MNILTFRVVFKACLGITDSLTLVHCTYTIPMYTDIRIQIRRYLIISPELSHPSQCEMKVRGFFVRRYCSMSLRDK